MSNTGDYNPEWGYLAPRPGIIRSLRMAFVAGVIGIAAGMAVAVALIARPTVDLSVAARTMAQLGEPDDVPNTLPNNSTKSAATSASAELLEVKGSPAASQATVRTAADLRDLTNFAAAESHSAATVQHPAALAGLAESPAITDNMPATPIGITPASAPKKISRTQQAAHVAALTEAPALRDDASAEISAKAAPTPSPKMTNKRPQQVGRVRTARADLNSHDRDGGPFDLFRTILGGNSFFNDQVR
jgi:hypothetical protein